MSGPNQIRAYRSDSNSVSLLQTARRVTPFPRSSLPRIPSSSSSVPRTPPSSYPSTWTQPACFPSAQTPPFTSLGARTPSFSSLGILTTSCISLGARASSLRSSNNAEWLTPWLRHSQYLVDFTQININSLVSSWMTAHTHTDCRVQTIKHLKVQGWQREAEGPRLANGT